MCEGEIRLGLQALIFTEISNCLNQYPDEFKKDLIIKYDGNIPHFTTLLNMMQRMPNEWDIFLKVNLKENYSNSENQGNSLIRLKVKDMKISDPFREVVDEEIREWFKNIIDNLLKIKNLKGIDYSESDKRVLLMHPKLFRRNTKIQY